MIKIYGIKNCDTMKKAFQWLDEHNIAYQFHDYKKLGIEAETIEHWLKKNSVEQLINTKGITWKKQTEEDKKESTNPKKAISLMIKNTSMIKRPLVMFGKDEYLLGFDALVWQKAL